MRISDWSSDVCSSDLDSAVGVYETGDVLVLDQEVGTIEDVDLRDDVVRITMSIRDDVPLPADVTATIQATSVLGQRSLALFPSWSPALEASGVPTLASGDTIPPHLPAHPDHPHPTPTPP